MSRFTPIILIIEDDPSVRAALAEALRLDDHPLMLVATVIEAENAWQRVESTSIGLVLTDIHLSARLQAYEGYQLYERWHRRDSHLPFLFMSGAPNGPELPAVRAGVVRFLAKPFAFGDLRDAVQETIRGAEPLEQYSLHGCGRVEGLHGSLPPQAW